MPESILNQLQSLLDSTLEQISKADSEPILEEIRLKSLGKKGELTQILRNLGSLSSEERPRVGQRANEVRAQVENLLADRVRAVKGKGMEERLQEESIDFTLPGEPLAQGRLHPLSQVMWEAIDIFRSMGFELVEGPEIETDYYNFEALNIPPDHPSRDMWDSLYLGPNALLRAHTSPVQVRTMEKKKPPLRVISAGKCYRRDAVDATHCFQFHQLEGFMVDENVSFANLKGVLSAFARSFFGSERKVQFVPSYFPFTEPSVEALIDCFNCEVSEASRPLAGGLRASEQAAPQARYCAGRDVGKCAVCGGEKWLEILGAGMIHPFVLGKGNTPKGYTGFAFGLGIERIAMLKYGITDIRLFYENDNRFLRQF